jgi:hypothetical protein
MSNQSLLCVQVANALHAQLNVVERIIAKKSAASFLSSKIGLDRDDKHAFQELQKWQGPEDQPIFQTSSLKNKKRD